jgi:hypothetical protein
MSEIAGEKSYLLNKRKVNRRLSQPAGLRRGIRLLEHFSAFRIHPK